MIIKRLIDLPFSRFNDMTFDFLKDFNLSRLQFLNHIDQNCVLNIQWEHWNDILTILPPLLKLCSTASFVFIDLSFLALGAIFDSHGVTEIQYEVVTCARILTETKMVGY